MAALSSSACSPCDEAPGTFCRIAGSGRTGFNGDGLTARETDFYQVTAARRGPDGLVYVMDFNNHRLRRVGNDGNVQTVVGNGEHDVAREGEPATSSPLENPIDFAFSPDGVLHLVMLHDARVLRIVDGKVEVFAGGESLGDSGDGGPARSARFTQLAGMVFAKDGTLYLADELTHRVRRVQNGVVHPVAGTGEPGFSGDGAVARQAQLSYPRGLALDAAEEHLYIADAGNNVVRRVRLANGLIETVAGTGESGGSGDGGPAMEARLDRPSGVVVAEDGTLYIADTDNHRVRRVTPDGMIQTVAGTGTRGSEGGGGTATEAQLAGPFGLAFDGPDKLIVSELRGSAAGILYLE